MEDWGEIKETQIDRWDFWVLMDELVDDNSDFYHNRSIILEAYKEGTLFGLCVSETDSMLEREAREDEIFCKDDTRCSTPYLLPCFCVIDGTLSGVDIIWTHTRARRNGFARKLLKLCELYIVREKLPESLDFWKKMKEEGIIVFDHGRITNRNMNEINAHIYSSL